MQMDAFCSLVNLIPAAERLLLKTVLAFFKTLTFRSNLTSEPLRIFAQIVAPYFIRPTPDDPQSLPVPTLTVMFGAVLHTLCTKAEDIWVRFKEVPENEFVDLTSGERIQPYPGGVELVKSSSSSARGTSKALPKPPGNVRHSTKKPLPPPPLSRSASTNSAPALPESGSKERKKQRSPRELLIGAGRNRKESKE